jgi:D-alanine transaminase
MNLYLNGRFMPLEEGRVSVEDRGFQFGDGVYEVVRVYRGKPFRLEPHLRRLEQSCRGIEMGLPEPLERIAGVCRRLVEGHTEAQIYLQVTRGVAPRLHTFPKDAPPTFLAYSRPVTPPAPDRVYRLKVVMDDRWGRCHLKVICLLPNLLAKQKASEAGCDEGLFVRDDGFVTEGASSNAFFVRGGVLWTHPSGPRILNGVTRETVLEVAAACGVAVRQEALRLPDALAADEAFVTGTLAEIAPVVAIDGRPVGTGTPGPVTLGIQSAFRDLTRRECP